MPALRETAQRRAAVGRQVKGRMVGPMAYDAFISYSHENDAALAEGIQRGLQRFAKPWHRRRALNVFRDSTGLSANPGLWTSITEVMAASRYLVVVCSPQAAASPWVSREIDHWRATKPEGHIIPVLAAGDLVWDDATGRFDPVASTAAPAAFAAAFSEEPLYVDMRWADQPEHLSLDNPGFRDDIADIAAPMHGVAKDELIGEDIHQHRRTLRYAWGAVGAVLLLAAATVVGATIAVGKADEAQRKADEVLVANKSLSHARRLRDQADKDRRGAVRGRRAAEKARVRFEQDAEASRIAARNADATAQEKTAAALAASQRAQQQTALAAAARGEALRAEEQQRTAEEGRKQALDEKTAALKDAGAARDDATQARGEATQARGDATKARGDATKALADEQAALAEASNAHADAHATALAAEALRGDRLESEPDLSLLLASASVQGLTELKASATSQAESRPNNTAYGALLTSVTSARKGVRGYLRFPVGQQPSGLKMFATKKGRIAAAETSNSIELGERSPRLYLWLDPAKPATELAKFLPDGDKLGCVNQLAWDDTGQFLFTVEDPRGCLNPDYVDPSADIKFVNRVVRIWQVDALGSPGAIVPVGTISPLVSSPLQMGHGLALIQAPGGVIQLEPAVGGVSTLPGFFLASTFEGDVFTPDGQHIIGFEQDLFTQDLRPVLYTRDGAPVVLSDPEVGLVLRTDPSSSVVAAASGTSLKLFSTATGAAVGSRLLPRPVGSFALRRAPNASLMAVVSMCDGSCVASDGPASETVVGLDLDSQNSDPLWTSSLQVPRGGAFGPIAFSPSGRFAVLESYLPHSLDATQSVETTVLDSDSGAEWVQTAGRTVVFSAPDDRFMVVQERDVQTNGIEVRASVRGSIWDMAKPDARGVLVRTEGNVDLEPVPGEHSVLAYATTVPTLSGAAKSIEVWDLDEASIDAGPRVLPLSTGAVNPVADPGGDIVAMASGATRPVVLNPTIRPYEPLDLEPRADTLRTAISRDARLRAVSTDARTIVLKTLGPGGPTGQVPVPSVPLQPGEQILYMTFSRDSKWLFVNLADAAGHPTASIGLPLAGSTTQPAVGAARRLDGEQALSSSGDGSRFVFRVLGRPAHQVVVRDAATLAEVWRSDTSKLPDDADPRVDDLFVLDWRGTHVAGTNGTGQAVIWRQVDARGEFVKRFSSELGEVDELPRFGVAFSPDGSRIAVNGPDRRLRLFEVGTGKLMRSRPLPGSSTANRIKYTDDGGLLLVDGVMLLDASTLDQIGPRLHPDEWTNPADRGTQATDFTPDGRYIVADRVDGTEAVRYEVGLDLLRERACALAGRNLTVDEQDTFRTGPNSGHLCAAYPPDGG